VTASLPAQTLNNQSLTGKYYFRQVSILVDAAGSVREAHSLLGTLTFDGVGRYSLTGQRLDGTAAAVSASASGAYSVDPAGFTLLDNPLRSGVQINARLGTEALAGAVTESTDGNFDLFVAVRAPASGAAFNGPYWTATLEFPGASGASARNTLFSLNGAAANKLADFAVSGHAANVSGGAPGSQQVTGASYTLGPDGLGTISFGSGTSPQLLSGDKTLYLSATGNVILGGSTVAGSHDILIGVKAISGASTASWNGDFWGAGLRYSGNANSPDIEGYSGSLAARGGGKAYWTRRIKALGFGSYDFTGINGYSLSADGSGNAELASLALGAGGNAFVGSEISGVEPGAFEIYFGMQMTPLSGSGVFLNPQKILNAAGFGPAGNPIAPGEFLALQGIGLAPSNQQASPPYSGTLNGVTVLINNKPCGMEFVSATQINCVVPYSLQGTTATIVVQNNGGNSNQVTVPVAPTAPAMFALDQSGSGPGAVLHADFSLVNAAKPAVAGETVLLFLTGMGAVTPTPQDGMAGSASPLNSTTASPISVLVGGEPAAVQFSFLHTVYPGLYQMNVKLPSVLPGSGTLPLAIETPNAFHDQVDIVVR
jgi:uncharacterized protein (TIGR03437 family)